MRIFDLHCDTVTCTVTYSRGKTGIFNNGGHIDIQKLRAGGALCQSFAIFVPSGEHALKHGFNDDGREFFETAYGYYQVELEKNREYIAPALCGGDISANRKKGKISALLTVEDAALVQDDLCALDYLYSKGVRMIAPLWNKENCFGYPCSDDEELTARGLKPFGIEALGRMNELGIIMDVSHLSDGGFKDVYRHSKKPFVASHSNARALCPHRRNLTDEMLKMIGDSGGVVGVNFLWEFLNEKSAGKTRIEDIVRHAVYIRGKAGADALAFGSDFDGIDGELEFGDYSGFDMIIDALSKALTAEEIEKMCGKNALRVLKDCID